MLKMTQPSKKKYINTFEGIAFKDCCINWDVLSIKREGRLDMMRSAPLIRQKKKEETKKNTDEEEEKKYFMENYQLL